MPSPFHVPSGAYAGLGLEPAVLPLGVQPPEIAGYPTKAAIVVCSRSGDINCHSAPGISACGGFDEPPTAIQVQPTKIFDEADAFTLMFVGYDPAAGAQKCLWLVANAPVVHDRCHFAPMSGGNLIAAGAELVPYVAPKDAGLAEGSWYMYLLFCSAAVDAAAATAAASAADFTVAAVADALDLGAPVCATPFKLDAEAWAPDLEPSAPE